MDFKDTSLVLVVQEIVLLTIAHEKAHTNVLLLGFLTDS